MQNAEIRIQTMPAFSVLNPAFLESFMRPTLAVLALILLTASTALAADTVVKDLRLVQAAKAGDSATAIALLGRKIDPNIAEPDGTTPLHWAVRNNDAALVDRLIRAGADVKATNRYGISAGARFFPITDTN